MLVFDIETDGFLANVSKIHCLNAVHTITGEEFRFTDHEFYQDLSGNQTKVRCPRKGTLADGVALLEQSAAVGGWNIIDYDLPVIRKLCAYNSRGKQKARDGRVMSRVMYTNLKDRDFAAVRKGTLPQSFVAAGHIGNHSVAAWGIRLKKQQKGDFDPKNFTNPHTGEPHTWATIPFIQEMDDYCAQDVRTTAEIFEHFNKRVTKDNYCSDRCFDIEHDVAKIIHRQERFGWLFDSKAAEKLTAGFIIDKLDLEQNLRSTFPIFYVRDGARTAAAKKSMKRWTESIHGGAFRTVKEKNEAGLKIARQEQGWHCFFTEGAPFTKIKAVEFNPGSRDHCVDRLTKLFNWVPTEFTPGGKPQLDEATLGALTQPEAKLIAAYFKVEKKLGQLSEGKKAWLKYVGEDGRIHGRINTNGAVTGRMTHSDPNVAQADKDHRMRALWIVPRGRKLTGCDAEGLELRMLAHYMAAFDKGAYVKTVCEGTKELGTDPHTINKNAIGLNSRDSAKTWIYAFLYGAADYMLGTIVVADFTDAQRDEFNAEYPPGDKRDGAISRIGARSRAQVLKTLPALKKFIDTVKKAAKRGYLKGLDGRRLHVRSPHAGPNTLLQGGGAIVMKRALVIADESMQQRGYIPGVDYEFVGNIHDEFQQETDEKIAEETGKLAAAAIKRAGEEFGLRCPLGGSYAVGNNWSETH